ncbi:Serine/threonine-protein kinase par-1 [Chytriomyces hyalinus]|nr:Serine/threonine-protein kinase par-1 [Chytriomyces hyalinus]
MSPPSKSRKDKDDTNNPDFQLNGIGNYLFQKTVGEGNFAKVKLAKHKLTGVEVAVKVIDKTTLDEKKLGKLYREVRIMKLLNHPHIVKLYEVIETKHTVFLVMEYASGGELYDYLVVHGKMKEKEARAKFRQILSAVSYCHKKRVIHRDLKAENLLLDANLDIKIADFGFSNHFDPDGKLDTFCGSPPYAAPELFQGKRYTGPEVDVWSLGVILYVLTTGCLPFDGKNLQEMRESVCRGKYRIPFYLSDVCEKLLRKFLIRDPFKRANLDFLNDDPWINDGYAESPIARDISTTVQEDEVIIKLLETKYNISAESVQKCLRENIYDDVAAMYYLLYYDKEAKSRRPSEVPQSGVPSIQIPDSSDSPPLASPVDGPKSATAAIPSQQQSSSTSSPPSTTTKPELGASLRPQATGAKDKKRRFTVGNENEAQKLADEYTDGTTAHPKVAIGGVIVESGDVAHQLGNQIVQMDTSRLNNAISSTAVPIIDIQQDEFETPANGTRLHAVSASPGTMRVGLTNVGAAPATNKSPVDGSDDQVGGRKRGTTIVAVKVIDKTTLDEKKLGKLYREVRIMKLLNHPHIVKLYEVIETKHTVFLVMEYASGGELYDYLVVHGKMKEKEARAKFRQILSAVSYCHKKRVIHRDLKAENLLLDANLDIKIADFGFSNHFDPDGKLDTFCGSPPYAAPELFQGKRYTGPEVDVWSLGVILYVLTTGCLPFDGKNLQEMRESVCRGKYRIPFYLSDVCEKLLRKFLIRDPFKRANLDFLNDDPWINDGYAESPIARDISTTVQEDEVIIKLLETKYNISAESVQKCLRENIYDDVAAMYYLLYYDKEAKSRRPSEVPHSGVPSIQIPASSDSPPLASPVDGPKSATAAIPSQQQPSSTSSPPSTTTKPELGASLRPQATGAKDKKRRFTVGNENEAQKLADEYADGTTAHPKVAIGGVIVESGDVAHQLGNQTVQMDTSRLNNASSSTAVPTIDIQQDEFEPLANGSRLHAVSASPGTMRVGLTNVGVSPATNKSPVDGSDDQVGGRKRGTTIVGLLRSSIRRTSDVGAMSPMIQNLGKNAPGASEGPRETMATVAVDESTNAIDTMMSQLKTDDNKPRSLRFTFNSSTTSSKPPEDIVKGVSAALDKHGVTYRMVTPFLLECFWANPAPGKDGVKFEIEVCKLPRLKNLHGLRFKRLAGASADYKDICEKVFGSAGL